MDEPRMVSLSDVIAQSLAVADVPAKDAPAKRAIPDDRDERDGPWAGEGMYCIHTGAFEPTITEFGSASYSVEINYYDDEGYVYADGTRQGTESFSMDESESWSCECGASRYDLEDLVEWRGDDEDD